MTATHLHVVDADAGTDDDPVAWAPKQAADVGSDVEALVELVREGASRLDGASIVALDGILRDVATSVGELRRLVSAAGNAYCQTHGNRGRVDIDGVTYRATVTGSSTSLKEPDRRRLAKTFFEDRLAPWLSIKLGSEKEGDDTDVTSRLYLSLIVEKLTEVMNLSPKVVPLREKWAIDAAKFETPSTGAGPVPTFEKVVDNPPTKKKEAHRR